MTLIRNSHRSSTSGLPSRPGDRPQSTQRQIREQIQRKRRAKAARFGIAVLLGVLPFSITAYLSDRAEQKRETQYQAYATTVMRLDGEPYSRKIFDVIIHGKGHRSLQDLYRTGLMLGEEPAIEQTDRQAEARARIDLADRWQRISDRCHREGAEWQRATATLVISSGFPLQRPTKAEPVKFDPNWSTEHRQKLADIALKTYGCGPEFTSTPDIPETRRRLPDEIMRQRELNLSKD